MRRALILALGTALCAAPAVVVAAPASPAAASFKAPRNNFGQPDLGGFWSNATLTPMTRSPKVGGRAVYTAEEVKQLEGNAAQEIEDGNQATDPNAPAAAYSGRCSALPLLTAVAGAFGSVAWLPSSISWAALPSSCLTSSGV